MLKHFLLALTVLSAIVAADGCTGPNFSHAALAPLPLPAAHSVERAAAVDESAPQHTPPVESSPAELTTHTTPPPVSRLPTVEAEEPRTQLERLPPLEQFSQDLEHLQELQDGAFAAAYLAEPNTVSRPSSWSERDALPSQLEYGIPRPRVTTLPDPDNTTYLDLADEQWSGICQDHANFYSLPSLAWIGVGLGVGAAMANTPFDEHLIHDTYSENVVFAPTDEYYEKLHQPEFLGNGLYTIPVFAVAALAEPLIEDLPLGEETAEWGQRSLRTVLVGAPPMLGLQLLTGASRPNETNHDSQWKPFQDNNGVSGHSFMGAVPFLSAAKMTDNIWLKSGLYVASTLPALSRVNDDRHYFSQAFLGWWIAYAAATAVDHSHRPDAHYQFFAYPTRSGAGLGVEFHY